MRNLVRPMILVVLLLISGCEPPKQVGRSVGNIAPDFAGQNEKGELIKLSDFKGKVVLLDFWGTWCRPCLMMVPHEQALMQQYSGRPFTVLGVAMDTRAKLLEYLQSNPLPWPNILDETRTLAEQWNAEAVPMFLLIDHEGVILQRHVGMFDNNDSLTKSIKQAVEKAEKK